MHQMTLGRAAFTSSADGVQGLAPADIRHSVVIRPNGHRTGLVIELRLDWRAEAAHGRLSYLHLRSQGGTIVHYDTGRVSVRILRQ